MKKITLLFVAIALLVNGFGQTPGWAWAQSAGGTSGESGFSIAMDANDNVYVTGVFQSPGITFGTITLTNNSINSYDVFIVKYTSAGNPVWAYSGGGTGVDYGYGICTDGNGNVFVTGTFTSAITFGSTTLTTNGVYDIFLAKFDSSGNALWAKSAGGTNFDYSYNISSDTFGNAYISGHFSSASITFGNITLTNSSFNNRFLVKYDSSGNAIWARRNGPFYLSGNKADHLGNIVLTGSFYDPTITFGSTILTNADASGNTSDIFIAKYDTAGNVIWAKRAGGTDDDGASSINVDANDNIFITGCFLSSALTFSSSILNCSSTYGDIFVAKYDSAGVSLWGRDAGGSYNQCGNGISTDANGNVYITGMFQSATCSFGSITLTNAGAVGNEDIFVAKYNASGNVLWAVSAGGIPQDVSSDICSNAFGNACITGYFWSSSITFGSTVLNNNGGPNSGDIFTAKLDYATGSTELISTLNELSLLPNPVTNELGIENAELRIEKIELYDLIGEKVFQSNFSNPISQISVDVRQLPSGIYFVRVKTDKRIRTAKFVKE